jgi:hypothetical protein
MQVLNLMETIIADMPNPQIPRAARQDYGEILLCSDGGYPSITRKRATASKCTDTTPNEVDFITPNERRSSRTHE